MAKTGRAGPVWSTTSRCSCSSPGRSTGNDSGGTTSPVAPVLSQTRLLTLPGSIATTNVDAGSASCNKPTTTSRPLRKRHQDAPAGTGSTAIRCWRPCAPPRSRARPPDARAPTLVLCVPPACRALARAEQTVEGLGHLADGDHRQRRVQLGAPRVAGAVPVPEDDVLRAGWRPPQRR